MNLFLNCNKVGVCLLLINTLGGLLTSMMDGNAECILIFNSKRTA